MKTLLITLGLALASPPLLAQLPQGPEMPKPATPATPADPATPAEPATPPDGPVVDGPRTTDKGQASGSVRHKRNSVGATGNPTNQSGKVRLRSENGNEFGFLDADGDGALSRDEVKGDAELSGEFGKLDENSDGQLSRPELAARGRATPSKGGGRS